MTLTAGKIAELFTALQFKKAINLANLAATPATTGTMTVPMSASITTITPTGNCTFNASSGGTVGQAVVFIVTTLGAVSFTLVFGTHFKSTGNLATGVTTAKTFTVAFTSNGSAWYETGRTGPL